MKILYRYEGYSEWSLKRPLEMVIWKETKCGYWVTHPNGSYETCKKTGLFIRKKKWISKTGRKRFAYPTKKEAMVSYIARKQSQIRHCIRIIHYAEEGLRVVGESDKSVIREKFRMRLLDG